VIAAFATMAVTAPVGRLEQGGIPVAAEETKALVRRGWEEVINRRTLDFLAEAHTADSVWHEPDQDIQGIE
jgi:hypothetical protein